MEVYSVRRSLFVGAIVLLRLVLVSPNVSVAQQDNGATPFPTQTPVAVAAALSQPFAYGVASGDMTTTSAVLWTRTPDAADVSR